MMIATELGYMIYYLQEYGVYHLEGLLYLEFLYSQILLDEL